MAAYKGWVYLEDEMPRIGSGLRLVEGEVGRKWVRLRSATSPTPSDRSRIHISIWRKIIRRTEKRGIPWK
jgi:hypothetical protein